MTNECVPNMDARCQIAYEYWAFCIFLLSLNVARPIQAFNSDLSIAGPKLLSTVNI